MPGIMRGGALVSHAPAFALAGACAPPAWLQRVTHGGALRLGSVQAVAGERVAWRLRQRPPGLRRQSPCLATRRCCNEAGPRCWRPHGAARTAAGDSRFAAWRSTRTWLPRSCSWPRCALWAGPHCARWPPLASFGSVRPGGPVTCMQESEWGRFSCIPMSIVAAGKRGAWVWILGPQRLFRDPLQQGGVGAGVSLN